MHREYIEWSSPHLGRRMEMLWFGHWGPAAVLFPTSLGRFHQYEDFGLVKALGEKLDRGELQIACVDSVDAEGWYNGSASPLDRARRHEDYDRYLRNELAPYVLDRTSDSRFSVFGASFGAYHAANFAGRYPEITSRAVLFSGLYDVHRFLDGFWSDTCYFHCPTAYISNMDESWAERLRSVAWIIATGEYDSLVDNNRGLSRLLSSKGIPNHLEIWPGVFGHDWQWWNASVGRFLP